MVSDQLNNYPDYLKNFEVLDSLKQWQWRVISRYAEIIRQFFLGVKIDVLSGEFWPDFVRECHMRELRESAVKLHRKYPVTTLEVLKEYFTLWYAPSDFALEYDNAAGKLKMTVRSSVNTEKRLAQIRKLIPCNMPIEVNPVEKLS